MSEGKKNGGYEVGYEDDDMIEVKGPGLGQGIIVPTETDAVSALNRSLFQRRDLHHLQNAVKIVEEHLGLDREEFRPSEWSAAEFTEFLKQQTGNEEI